MLQAHICQGSAPRVKWRTRSGRAPLLEASSTASSRAQKNQALSSRGWTRYRSAWNSSLEGILLISEQVVVNSPDVMFCHCVSKARFVSPCFTLQLAFWSWCEPLLVMKPLGCSRTSCFARSVSDKPCFLYRLMVTRSMSCGQSRLDPKPNNSI